MTNDERPLNDILAQLEISSIQSSQTTNTARENNVEDLNDDNINTEMNKQNSSQRLKSI
jgi:hypothetical protein